VRRDLVLVAGLFAAHCGDPAEYVQSGATEPMRVQNAQFFSGPLPEGTAGPGIRSVVVGNPVVRAGQSGWSLGGNADKDAVAVALRMAEAGSGFWVLPLTQLDFLLNDGSYAWGTKVDFSRDLPAGKYNIDIVAVKPDMTFGPLMSEGIASLRVLPLVPDADVVLSLEWDTDADLDLHLVGPLETTAKELDPKHPTTGVVDPNASELVLPPGTGMLDRDSNARCTRDGWRREDVVWNSNEPGAESRGLRHGLPLNGTYVVRVDMFDACAAAYANFKVTLYVQGTEYYAKAGHLLAIDSDGGGPGSGLYVGSFQLAF
jgi:hypothetical protein